MLNKKNGLLVLDDELVSSHATDVKLKTVSDHKSGKKEPVSECISNSQLRTLFAMQLRTKRVSCDKAFMVNGRIIICFCECLEYDICIYSHNVKCMEHDLHPNMTAP